MNGMGFCVAQPGVHQGTSSSYAADSTSQIRAGIALANVKSFTNSGSVIKTHIISPLQSLPGSHPWAWSVHRDRYRKDVGIKYIEPNAGVRRALHVSAFGNSSDSFAGSFSKVRLQHLRNLQANMKSFHFWCAVLLQSGLLFNGVARTQIRTVISHLPVMVIHSCAANYAIVSLARIHHSCRQIQNSSSSLFFHHQKW